MRVPQVDRSADRRVSRHPCWDGTVDPLVDGRGLPVPHRVEAARVGVSEDQLAVPGADEPLGDGMIKESQQRR